EEVVRVDRLLLLSERDQDVVEKLPRFLDRPGIAALVGWNRVAEGVGEELDDAKGRSEDTWEHLVLMVGGGGGHARPCDPRVRLSPTQDAEQSPRTKIGACS